MRTPSFHLVSAPSLPLPSRPHRPQLSLQPPTKTKLPSPPCALSRHLQPAPGQSASPSVNTTTTPQTTAVQPAAWLAGVCLSTHHQCRELPHHHHIRMSQTVCLVAAASRHLSGGRARRTWPACFAQKQVVVNTRQQEKRMTGMDSARRLDSLPWPMKGDSGAKYRRLLPRWHWCSVRLAPLKDQHRPLLMPPPAPPSDLPGECPRESNPARCTSSPVYMSLAP